MSWENDMGCLPMSVLVAALVVITVARIFERRAARRRILELEDTIDKTLALAANWEKIAKGKMT